MKSLLYIGLAVVVLAAAGFGGLQYIQALQRKDERSVKSIFHT